jgi:DNA (cytosine-5)-methyltransferase 1
MNELALFAGAGGGILGGSLLGWRTVAAVEIEEYPRAVLLQRQADGILPRFPIWDDIRTFDGKPWKGKVNIITGGFPCQDISAAGKGAGIEGERSGLWSEMARIIGEVRPGLVLVENSPVLTSRGLGRVLADLAEMGYNARWGVLGADDAGAPHRRKRIWILAYADIGPGCSEQRSKQKSGAEQFNGVRENWSPDMADTDSKRKPQQKGAHRNKRGRIGNGGQKMGNTIQPGLERQPRNESDRNKPGRDRKNKTGSACPASISWWDIDPADLPDTASMGQSTRTADGKEISETSRRSESDIGDTSSTRKESWPTQPRLGRVAHGVANRVDRLKAIGNGQVSAVAAIAFLILSEGL